ncbi:hypothetical protein V2J09_016152 [Rumex salicifolius]
MDDNGRLSPDSVEFGDWINRLCLVDLKFKGQRYTWFRDRDTTNKIAKRLDRVLCCAQGRLRWQEAPSPMLHSFPPTTPHCIFNSRRPFRFEAAWLSHEDFKALLAASWNPNLSTLEALNQLREVRKLIEISPSDALMNKDTELEKELELILEQEEIL